MKIYIGTSGGYEHSHNIKAFATEAQAIAWVAACKEYENDPKRPVWDDTWVDLPDDEYEEKHRKQKQWDKKHPAGENDVDGWYGYQVMEVIKP